MSRFARIFAAGALSLALLVPISSPSAGALAPKKASQLRTVSGTTSITGAPCGLNAPIAAQVNADGVQTPFSIPAGSVFILTGWEWSVQGGNPLGMQEVALQVGPSVVTFDDADLAGPDASGIVQIPAGIAVASGMTVCAFSSGLGGIVILHGFMAKDK